MKEGDITPKKPVKPTGTVFDVKRPGKTPLQTTSRPVIVGHKPIVRDPLTTGKVEQYTHEKHIIPDIKRPAQAASRLAEPAPVRGPTSPEVAASPELAAVAAELTTPAPKSAESAAVSAQAPAAEKPAAPTEKVDDAAWIKPEDAAKEEPSKEYVPASTASVIPQEPTPTQKPISPELRREMDEVLKSHSEVPEPEGVMVAGEHGPINFVKVLLWFISVILLVIIVGDALLDAGVISTSVNIPHTHLIKK